MRARRRCHWAAAATAARRRTTTVGLRDDGGDGGDGECAAARARLCEAMEGGCGASLAPSMATQTLAARPVVALAAPSRAFFCAARAECAECVADGFCVYCGGRCVEARACAAGARRIAGKAGCEAAEAGGATALQPRHVDLRLVAAAERTEGPSAPPLTLRAPHLARWQRRGRRSAT